MEKRVIAKFGGTSVAHANAMRRSAQISLERGISLVVVSACAGITDKLVEIGNCAHGGDWNKAFHLIQVVRQRHYEIATDLAVTSEILKGIESLIQELETLAQGVSLLKDLTPRAHDSILSIGERLSSLLFRECLQSLTQERRVKLVDARELIITNADHGKARPKISHIRKRCAKKLALSNELIYVTQGFIGSSTDGHTTTLGRGGSDATAALLAEGLNADLLEIWTDVAGVATTDPNICPDAVPIDEITYLEAAEMAQYGAKVLHPATITPAMRAGIEIFVGSSMDKNRSGTWIKKTTSSKPVLRAIAKRGNQSLLVVRTPEMLHASGFLAKIFKVFRKHKVSVDCVTTSEISIAVTLDNAAIAHGELVKDLGRYGEVIIENGFALISIIGNQMQYTRGIGGQVFRVLEDINVRMICLGASDHNFCIVVAEDQVNEAIRRLHKFFLQLTEPSTRRNL